MELQATASQDLTDTLTPKQFRDKLLIDCDGEPRQFSNVLDSWQQEDFNYLDEGWKALAGWPQHANSTQRRYFRAFLERPRGHSKTSDTAVSLSWILSQSPRKVVGYWAASDRDQAALGRDAIDTLCRINPWLALTLDRNRYTIANPRTGSHLEIVANDVEGSFGYLPDFVVCDELTHWKRRGMWDSLFSSAAKRALCMLIIITNAGMQKYIDWQWSVRESARENENWYFHTIEGPQASWITAERLQEQRALLTPSVYNRLWLNIWSTGDGDHIPEQDLQAAITQLGPITTLADERRNKSPGLGELAVIGGLDMGIHEDHAGLVALCTQYGTCRIRLADCKSWRPRDYADGEVPVHLVEKAVLDFHRRLGFTKVYYDPNQCEYLAQRLRRAGVIMEPMPFVGKNLNEMAEKLVQVFRGRIVDLYDHPDLLRDLRRLQIVEKAWGLKLESAKTEDGHADLGIAFAIALPEAMRMGHKRAFTNLPPTGGRARPNKHRTGTHFGARG